jgi:hypothetical protein
MDALQRETSLIGEENEAMVSWASPRNSSRPRTPRRKHGCCGGSRCRCSATSLPASWGLRNAWALRA